MIDYDDVEDVFWMSGAWFAAAIVAISFLYFAYQNDKECQQKVCPGTAKPKLTDNSCLCVLGEAK